MAVLHVNYDSMTPFHKDIYGKLRSRLYLFDTKNLLSYKKNSNLDRNKKNNSEHYIIQD